MFESAEVGHRIGKAEYARQEPLLREALLKAQYRLLEDASFPVVIVIGGVDGAGKGETVNLLNEWMDPRHIVTRAFGTPTDEEAQRPPMWRFWRALPPKGRIGILFGSWYTEPIVRRAEGQMGKSELIEHIEQIRHFERMLVAEGALVLKFWFHLSRAAQKKRLQALSDDPDTRWRVTDTDWLAGPPSSGIVSAIARGSSGVALADSKLRMSRPIGPPEGSAVRCTRSPWLASQTRRRSVWLVVPAPSIPSRTMKRPGRCSPGVGWPAESSVSPAAVGRCVVAVITGKHAAQAGTGQAGP